jgi:hypothetical protein
MFQSGQTSVVDGDRSRCPSTSTNEQNMEHAHPVILKNHRELLWKLLQNWALVLAVLGANL